MATILKRKRKNGISYRIMVRVKDVGTNKIISKSMTWRPPTDLDAREEKRELDRIVVEFESEVRNSFGIFGNNNKMDITFNQYAKMYLKQKRENLKPNSYIKSKENTDILCGFIGNVKLSKINPIMVQRLFSNIDKRKIIRKVYVSKTSFVNWLEDNKINCSKLRKLCSISNETAKKIFSEDHINYDSAVKVANSNNLLLNDCFIVKEIKKKYATSTNLRIKSELRTILNFAKKQLIIKENYASGDFVDFGKQNIKEIKCMNEEQAKQFVKSLNKQNNIQMRNVLKTLLFSGMRRGELCALSWKDIDFENKVIHIRRNMTEIKGRGKVEGTPKTESSKRKLTMSENLFLTLKEQNIWQNKIKNSLGILWKGEGDLSDKVFTTQYGKPLNLSRISEYMNNALQDANLPHYSVHSLRHTNITLQIEKGVPLTVISARAGHAKISTTLDIYSHYLNGSDKLAIKAIDEIFEY